MKQHTKQFTDDKQLSEKVEHDICDKLRQHYGLECEKIETNNSEIDFDLIDQDGILYEVKAYRKNTVRPWNQLCVELSSNGRDKQGWIDHCKAAGVQFLITCLVSEDGDVEHWYVWDFNKLYKNVQDTLRFFVPDGQLEEREWNKIKIVQTKSEGKWLLFFKDVYAIDSDWSIKQKYLRKCLVTPTPAA